MIQPATDLRTIRARHVPAWPARRLAVVTLMTMGYPDKVVAVALGTTERAVRRNVAKAAECVFEGTGVGPARKTLATWFWCHATCCTAGALRAAENGTFVASA